MPMNELDKYKAIEAIVDAFYQTCPSSDASNAALGVVIAITAVIKQTEGDADG